MYKPFHQTHTKLSKMAKILSCNIKYQIKKPDGGSVVKNQLANAGDTSLIPGLGGFPGEGNGKPHQYPCLGNPMNRGALRAIVHGVEKSWMQLK